ncbi:helix-turn-helix domain-containing protein [Undibacterium sp. SXout11W]|uniref:helix-turn-helix domain-containing protein n=1 Tax=Undibacterium sp. SXout11W TaxID=3413050 RepID=UPI003BF20067
MNTIQYLNEAKAKLGISSDYALAQHLGVTRSYMSKLMAGKNHLSDELAQEIAKIIGVHSGIVVLDMHRQRAITPSEVNLWNEIYKGFQLLLLPAKRTLV